MLKVGDIAPDFELLNTDGQNVRLYGKLKTSPLLLTFYKNNCPTCQFTFPHLGEIAKKLGPEYFLGIGQDSVVDTKAFKIQYKGSFEFLSDGHPYSVSDKYGIQFVPTLFVIEGDKTISHIAEGFDKKTIEDFANRISSLKKIKNFHAFDPSAQVPLLKPG